MGNLLAIAVVLFTFACSGSRSRNNADAPASVAPVVATSYNDPLLSNVRIGAATYEHPDEIIALTGEEVSFAFAPAGGVEPYTFAIVFSPNTDAATLSQDGIFTFTPTEDRDYYFLLRATDANGFQIDLEFNLKSLSYRFCMFHGSISSDFADAQNWSFCAGSVPGATETISIYKNAPNIPIVATNTTIGTIGQNSLGGGELRVGSGVTLTIGAVDQTIKGDITLAGESADCSDCYVAVPEDFAVLNDATLTLKDGITIGIGNLFNFTLGDGNSGGHLVTAGSGISGGQPPKLTSLQGTNPFFATLYVYGTLNNPSTLEVDGLVLNSILHLHDFYDVKRFDNVHFKPLFSHYVKVDNCIDVTFSDKTWDGILFDSSSNFGTPSRYFFEVGSCAGFGPVNVQFTNDAANRYYMPAMAVDPDGLFAFTGSASSICTWNGSVNSAWNNPANWDNCNNGRRNFPDANDKVIVNSGTPNNIIITGAVYTRQFAPGGTGGTVTIASGGHLFLNSGDANIPEIQSDIQFDGSPAACTDCLITGAMGIDIANNATLTLGNGITVQVYRKIWVGSGSVAGHLATVTDTGNTNEYPRIEALKPGPEASYLDAWGGLYIQHGGSVNIDGLILRDLSLSIYPAAEFHDSFTVHKFDNVLVNHYPDATLNAPWFIIDCGISGAFIDKEWIIDFQADITQSVVMDSACASISNGNLTTSTDELNIRMRVGGSNVGYDYSEDDSGGLVSWPD